jgi:metallo-beta-lactamase family protein
MPTFQFLGAAGTVTGSKCLVTAGATRFLVDAGLFQGGHEEKQGNWEPAPEADFVVLTHAHLDHTGFVPRMVRQGYGGPVYATPGTADLLSLLWPDAGFLQDEEARHAHRHGWSRQANPEPLFTPLDAQRALRHLATVPYDRPTAIAPDVTLRYRPAGHIIGAATAELELEGLRVVFSGDLGRNRMALLNGPARVPRADVLVVESTYGDRLHAEQHPKEVLAEVVNAAVARRGMLVVPSFAIGRTQELLLMLRELEDARQIQMLDVFVDSPMAVSATELTLAHREDFNPAARALLDAGALTPRRTHLVRDVQQSKALNTLQGPGIILSASGMATGGRIKHHLAQRLPDPRNTICLAGYQAYGTRGRALEEGAHQTYIFGHPVPVRAHVTSIPGLSAHADQGELLAWLQGFEAPPRQTYVVHGEPAAREALAGRIRQELGWEVILPARGEAYAAPSVSLSLRCD